MSSNLDSFWVVTAPSRNWDSMPTINVCDHEVPLPAYWKIVDLLVQGMAKEDIVHKVILHTGPKTLQVVTDVVESVAENQRLVSHRSTISNRSSTTPKKINRISSYHVGKEVRCELQAAECSLEVAQQREKRLLNEALAIAHTKEELKGKEMSPDERRKTTFAIDHKMKQILRQHQEVETEIKSAKRLTAMHKVSRT
ncbi:hypothetical protein A1O3_01063 [Capronia epimyces CBS 606.96]|uniref:Uncharacterized protein n=1 Tax=Capronia epimyces CBS 606.96 TaxID=1182542 RepID=W9YTD7_9EURO|nr:uncharacterized protein A1O3_01063 [Capronia epimyces CBS 606.96]EXJ92511.1 hypothetical protein A1O3_01063 [Capronia epimyces CBS 606.96]